MTLMDFTAFPKIARLNRECVITEKIDGTNAQVYIVDSMDPFSDDNGLAVARRAVPDGFGRWELMFAGSRTRWITPENDNFGFAAWVKANAEELFTLGPGQHFGEWWGGKIQRGYGLAEKRFSLFNVSRWADRHVLGDEETLRQFAPKCCHVVPVLYRGLFESGAVSMAIRRLIHEGSAAALGFMNPEGIIVYHTAANSMFKVTCEKDEQPKGKAA